jgi:hypothetical protein
MSLLESVKTEAFWVIVGAAVIAVFVSMAVC